MLLFLAISLIGSTTSSAADQWPDSTWTAPPVTANLSDVLRAYPVAGLEMTELRGRWADERLGLKTLLEETRLSARTQIAWARADSAARHFELDLVRSAYRAERQRWYTSPAFVAPISALLAILLTLQAVQIQF